VQYQTIGGPNSTVTWMARDPQIDNFCHSPKVKKRARSRMSYVSLRRVY